MAECIGCNPNGEYKPHEAHVECWQVGDVWIPCCSDRVLSWWSTSASESERERFQADAPERWIRPLGFGEMEASLASIGRAFDGLERAVKAGR